MIDLVGKEACHEKEPVYGAADCARAEAIGCAAEQPSDGVLFTVAAHTRRAAKWRDRAAHRRDAEYLGQSSGAGAAE